MKKYIVAFLIGIVAFVFFKLKFNPESILLRHLEKKYNKEFVIAYSGERSDGRSKWFEAEIYPKELVGTTREYDKYYWAKGFVEDGKGGDTYGGVLLNESANKFYLPKLKELFGKNVLPILNVEGYYEKTDFQEEMARRREFYKKDPKGNFFPISGGIYIFGRVESDEDREWYRKQIYEFVQFMKETGTFEYVALPINVLDERVLSKEFQENIELQQKLVDMGLKNKRKNVETFRRERRRLMNELPKNLTPYVKLEEINKTEIRNSVKWSVYNNLLTTGIYSPKYVESNSLEEEYGIKNYDKLSDVSFTYEEY